MSFVLDEQYFEVMLSMSTEWLRNCDLPMKRSSAEVCQDPSGMHTEWCV